MDFKNERNEEIYTIYKHSHRFFDRTDILFSFLDELPDNRTELNSGNVSKILVSAYPTTAICEIAEVSSDNVDAYPNNFTSDRLLEDLYKWESTSEQDQDSPAALGSLVTSR